MIEKAIRKFGLATPATLGLLLLASSSVAWGLSSITRDIELSILLLLSWLGILTGWLLATRNIKSRGVLLIALITSLILLLIFYSRFITAISNTMFTMNSILIKSIEESSSLIEELPSLMNNIKDLGQAFSEPFIHLIDWFNKFLNSEAIYNPAITKIIWSIIVWLAALWAGYYLKRKREPLIALTPFGMILAGSLNYVHGDVNPLLLFIGVTLVLIPLSHYKKREHIWIATHTDYAEDIALDTNLVALPIILMLLLIGTFVPIITVKQILRISQDVYQTYASKAEKAGELLGLEAQSDNSNYISSLQIPDLPREHLLGSGSELNEQVVMIVNVNDPSIPLSIEGSIDQPRYYLRGITYDRYTGEGWGTSPIEKLSYPGGVSVFENLLTSNQGTRMVIQDVQRIQNSDELLYASGTIVKADQEYQINRRITNGDDFDIFAGVIKGERYRVESLLIQFSDAQLQSAEGDIPTWVLERYLQLPASLPARVRKLAQEITHLKKTPYEKALAIEAYLRHYRYSLQVSKPPPEKDVADYFLFDLREGYCDYYATAMVVLARAVGIPSRLVIGYTSGTYDFENGQYIITEANAHSWPELYLPGIGWVEFEPTGGLPSFERPIWDNSTPEILELTPRSRFKLADLIKSLTDQENYALKIILLLILLIIIIWLFGESIKLRILSPTDSVRHAFRQLYRQGASLTKPNYRGDTPNEFSKRLQIRLQQISSGHRIWEFLRKGSKDVQNLTDIYNQSMYSSEIISPDKKDRTIHLWLRLHWQISFAKLKNKLTNNLFFVIITRRQSDTKMEKK